jgi:hypothetical protein
VACTLDRGRRRVAIAGLNLKLSSRHPSTSMCTQRRFGVGEYSPHRHRRRHPHPLDLTRLILIHILFTYMSCLVNTAWRRTSGVRVRVRVDVSRNSPKSIIRDQSSGKVKCNRPIEMGLRFLSPWLLCSAQADERSSSQSGQNCGRGPAAYLRYAAPDQDQPPSAPRRVLSCVTLPARPYARRGHGRVGGFTARKGRLVFCRFLTRRHG